MTPDKPTDPHAPPAGWQRRGRIMMVIRLLGGRAGGAERLFCDMANMFAEGGYDVTIVYCDSSKEQVPYVISPKVARLNLWGKASRNAPWYRAIDLVAAGYPRAQKKSSMLAPALAPADWLSKNLYFLRRLYAVARDMKPDLVLSFMPPANTPSLLAGWMAGAKVVPTNHNVPVHDFASDIRWDQNPIDKKLRLWSLRAAERVHVLFPTFAEWFPAELQHKIVPIPNGISAEFLEPTPPRPRRKAIVAAGRLTDVKNYGVLVDAWAKIAAEFPDWSVEIYGTGPRGKTLQAQIDKLRMGRAIKLMGQTSAIKDVYLSSEIMAHPAHFEGFGLSVAEALACGCPVVAYADCPGVNEFVHDLDNGLLVDRAGGADALAAGLARLIRDPALRQRLRERGQPSLASYTHTAFRDRWFGFVEDVIAGHRDGVEAAT